MKKMTCNQLGGACDKEFFAETFEEMKNLSKAHGMEMFGQNDKAHLNAMKAMKAKMTAPNAFQDWMASKEKEFDALPDI